MSAVDHEAGEKTALLEILHREIDRAAVVVGGAVRAAEDDVGERVPWAAGGGDMSVGVEK